MKQFAGWLSEKDRRRYAAVEALKLGHGGIRDIEFVIQFLQLLNGGAVSKVRTGNTLIAIERLGFMVAGALMIAVTMYVMGVRREWIRLAGVSIAAPIVIYFALKHIFSIQLP